MNKQLVVALATVSAALVMAVIALSFSEWSQGQTPDIVMISNGWSQSNGGIKWFGYVFGAGLLSGLLSMLLVFGETRWFRGAMFFIAGAVWGILSWFAGVFPVMAGLWMVFATLYVTQRFTEENRMRIQEGLVPVLYGQARSEASGYLLLGSMFTAGIKYGFSGVFVVILFMTALLFCTPIMIGEVMWEERRKKNPSQQLKLF